MPKAKDAFRTISEVADWLETPTHVLRFWESKFSQIRPVKGAGGRRYYRPSDMALLSGIKQLLHEDGLTIKGTQKLLRDKGVKYVAGLGQPATDDAAADAMPAETAPAVDAPDAPPIAASPPQAQADDLPEPAPDKDATPAESPPLLDAIPPQVADQHAPAPPVQAALPFDADPEADDFTIELPPMPATDPQIGGRLMGQIPTNLGPAHPNAAQIAALCTRLADLRDKMRQA